MLFASSLPLIAASCKNNETKEPKKEPEMDAPIAPPTDPGKNNQTKESKKEPETDTPIAPPTDPGKNNETKEPKKEPEMDAPITPPTDPGKDNPEKTDPDQNEEAKIIKTDISKLMLQTNLTNNTTKKDILELLKKQNKLGNLTESDFDFKLEKKALLNREGEISITSKSKSKLISGTLLLTIDRLQEVTPRKHKYSADKTVVLEIGYNKYGQIEQFDRNVKKVPEVLPEEVISLYSAFNSNENETIENIDKWDTSNIENMSQMFFGAKNFNTDISNWKTDKVKNMSYMFFAAKKFSKNLDKWNTANVENMNRMFQEAEAFNGNIST